METGLQDGEVAGQLIASGRHVHVVCAQGISIICIVFNFNPSVIINNTLINTEEKDTRLKCCVLFSCNSKTSQ